VSHNPPSKPRIEESWWEKIGDEFSKPYFASLKAFLQSEKKSGKIIFPPGPEIFNAFNSTPFDKVKVVIIGQDPYHGQGQAHGLCFSVRKGIAIPPSLVNIYKELKSDLGLEPARHGNLQNWADQGVLLLNAILTVESNLAASHHGKGWEEFTDAAIRALNENRSGIVFLLWGNYAQKKGEFIDSVKHLVLKSAHPSPFSANRFLGCRHFSKSNEYLESRGTLKVDWAVSD